MRAATASTPGYESLQEAAQWFAVLCSEEATERDRERWRAWLDQRREHRDAWQYVEKVSGQFDVLDSQADKQAADRALKSGNKSAATRRRVLGVIAAMSGAGVLGWLGTQDGPVRNKVLAWRADYKTGVGEIRDFLLADGTRIWLNTASALDEHYGTDLRRIRLLGGEALIETAVDAARRPFVADTDHGRMTALGTRFVIRHHEAHTYLAVYEGRVEIRTEDGTGVRILEANQQVTFNGHAIGEPSPADRARQAWSRGILVANDIPLRELVAELARYRRGYLGCAPEVADLRVMGTYSLRDPDRILALLEEALPVKVSRTLPWWVTVQAKE